jgi:16S rRNA (guanine1207-N2)-methyltransferase
METDHYFSEQPTSASEPTELEIEIRGLSLRLHSDRGVFSRDKIDTGSKLLVRAMDLPTHGNALDLGCGYGFIGIVAAILSPGLHVDLVDVNLRACELARRNCTRHNLTNTDVIEGDARQALGDRTYDLILCNPPYHIGKAGVYELLEDASHRLNPNGSMWMVGRTKQGIKSLARDVAPWFGHVTTESIKSGYRVIVGWQAEAPEED